MRATLIGIALFLGLAAPAHAGWQDTRATEIARLVWHNPCVNQMTIQRVSAQATFHDQTETVGWVTDGCTIHVSNDRPLIWTQFCTTVLHEAGHLAGYRDPSNVSDPEHSSNPDSVMYGDDNRGYGWIVLHGHKIAAGGDPRCARNGRPYLERNGVL